LKPLKISGNTKS